MRTFSLCDIYRHDKIILCDLQTYFCKTVFQAYIPDTDFYSGILSMRIRQVFC